MAIIVGVGLFQLRNQSESTDEPPVSSSQDSPETTVKSSGGGRVETVTYSTTYQKKKYRKTAYVYAPKSYREGRKMNAYYLLHGSGEMENRWQKV